MKRLFYYIPELMLVAGLLSVIGIYFSSTVPLRPPCTADSGKTIAGWGGEYRERSDAELYGKWMQVRQ